MSNNSLKKNIYLGIDFSVKKPGICILCLEDNQDMKDGKFIFLSEIAEDAPTKAERELMKKVTCDDLHFNFNKHIKPSAKPSQTELNRIHITQSKLLSMTYMSDINELIDKLIGGDDYEITIISEGLSFGSSGCAMLDLASYRQVFLNDLLYDFGKPKYENFYVYSPVTVKSVNGVNKKKDIENKSKTPMIDKFKQENINCTFHKLLCEGVFNKKDKKGVTQTDKYVTGIDDLVDAYFMIKTYFLKDFHNNETSVKN